MTFLNALKILLLNFTAGIKVALHKLVNVVILLALLATFSLGTLKNMLAGGIGANIKLVLKSSTPRGFFVNLNTLVQNFISLVKETSQTLWVFFLALLVILILGSLLNNIANFVAGDTLYQRMTANYKQPYFAGIAKNIKRAFLASLFLLLIMVPLNVLGLIVLYNVLRMTALSGILGNLAPFFLILAITVLIALKNMLTGFFIPAYLSTEKNISRSFVYGVQVACKNAHRILWQSGVMAVLAVFINLLMFQITWGVGLFVTVPATLLFFVCLDNTMFFAYNGQNYYTDSETIVVIRKVSEKIHIKKMIDII